MKQNIVWLGHDGFRIDASACIYIDPYQIVWWQTGRSYSDNP